MLALVGAAAVTATGALVSEPLGPARPSLEPVAVAATPSPPDRSFLDDIVRLERDVYGVTTARHDLTEVAAFAEVTGKAPNVAMFSVGWADGRFHRWLLEEAAEAGMVPMISWEPWDHRRESLVAERRSEQPAWTLRRILDGHHDAYIDSWATGIADWGHPVVIRLAHEMNGNWYPWSEGRNTNADGEFRAAWRHVHDRFAAAGADNVIWVWSPNLAYQGSTPLAGLYPGDEYTDWIGLSGYWGHFPATPTRLWPFDELFGPTLDEIRGFTALPVLITETAATEEGGFKAAWITDLLATVATRDELIGIVWFDVDKETDWRVTSSADALDAFRSGIADPRFGSADPDRFATTVGR